MHPSVIPARPRPAPNKDHVWAESVPAPSKPICHPTKPSLPCSSSQSPSSPTSRPLRPTSISARHRCLALGFRQGRSLMGAVVKKTSNWPTWCDLFCISFISWVSCRRESPFLDFAPKAPSPFSLFFFFLFFYTSILPRRVSKAKCEDGLAASSAVSRTSLQLEHICRQLIR